MRARACVCVCEGVSVCVRACMIRITCGVWARLSRCVCVCAKLRVGNVCMQDEEEDQRSLR